MLYSSFVKFLRLRTTPKVLYRMQIIYSEKVFKLIFFKTKHLHCLKFELFFHYLFSLQLIVVTECCF